MALFRRSTRLLMKYPMGTDPTHPPGEGFKMKRPPRYRNVMEVAPYREKGMPLVYPRWYEDNEEKIDHNYILFNRPQKHQEKVGLVVESMKRTVVVAVRYFVRYRNFARVVARTSRCWAHDEDNACVVGDVVHIRKAVRRGKFKSFNIVSILEPNIDGRERAKMGLAVMDEPRTPTNVTKWRPVFDMSRTDAVNEEEARRAEELAADTTAMDADYDGSLADRTGKDRWAFLDEENETLDDAEEDDDDEEN
eukprot:Hpha_TRINITY_DN33710_c0_g1::TRINITY_DN33710_c0_g1_i1::g.25188::m.25188